MEKDLGEFLKETKYCDFNNKTIRDLALEITKDCKTDREKAVALFYWVRDNIRYSFGNWRKKATSVLKIKKGMCTNKAVLLTSLLRVNRIPAGFGILKVKGQEYFGPIATPKLRKKVSKISTHIYSYVFLDNKWIKIDSSVDRSLSVKTHYFNPTTELTEWDGYQDAMENLDENHILSDEGPLFNIDQRLENKKKNTRHIYFIMGNLYLEFLREHKEKITSIDDLEQLFKDWLKRNNFLYYLLFLLFF